MAQTHRCSAIGCKTFVATHLFMCRRHWRMIPNSIQVAVLTTWRALVQGEEGAYTAYKDATRDAIHSVAQTEGK